MPHRSIRERRGRKKLNQVFELQLTSMMDVLIIIVVFLLKSYSTSIAQFSSVPGIKIPISTSLDLPPDSLQVIVTPEAMHVDNRRILEFLVTADASSSTGEAVYNFKNADLDEGGRRIVPLYDALVRAKEKSEVLKARSPLRDAEGNPLPFEGILAIQADKAVQYDTIRRVMYTAAAAGYKVFRFLALKKDQ
jgi:biopolymer transport protein ExbD